MRKLVFGLVILLGACASQVAETPAQRVFALQSDYNGLLAAALTYESQPRCAAGQSSVTSPCSNPQVVADIRAVETDAARQIKAAQDTVRSGADTSTQVLALNLASNALAGFRNVLLSRGVLKP